MEAQNVFSTNISRNYCIKNNLYELCANKAAVPINETTNKHDSSFLFYPKSEKHYIYVKKVRPKVKTVYDIRHCYEQEILTSLPNDLDKVHNLLMRKIKSGTSKQENTKSFIKTLMKSGKPLSKTIWQIIKNINIENVPNTYQCVYSCGKIVQVNGSQGGEKKMLCPYDLSEVCKRSTLKSKPLRKIKPWKSSVYNKFKPGPLSKKPLLDKSPQRFSLGPTEVVELPRPFLEVTPQYGVAVESGMVNFIHTLRPSSGYITRKWAEFTVSMVGKLSDKGVLLPNENQHIYFDLNYENYKTKTLMRSDSSDILYSNSKTDFIKTQQSSEINVFAIVENVVQDMLRAVDISIQQDMLYCENYDSLNEQNPCEQDQPLKRKCGVLDKINTQEKLTEIQNPNEACRKDYCALGCICLSLNQGHYEKHHCGLAKCIFQCQCNYSKYLLSKSSAKFLTENISNNAYADRTYKLRTNVKSSKKNSIFQSDPSCCIEFKKNKAMSLILPKLDLKNVETWCMVHNLYKCFCNGKYTTFQQYETYDNITTSDVITTTSSDLIDETENSSAKICKSSDITEDNLDSCARINAFLRRQYTDEYYSKTHKKIFLMEQNDTNLKNKLNLLVSESMDHDVESIDGSDESISKSQTELDNLINTSSPITDPSINKINPADLSVNNKESNQLINTIAKKLLIDRYRLLKWIDLNVKLHKEKSIDITKMVLEPPRNGNLALYPWNFIQNRFREGANHFMVTKNPPFRTVITKDMTHPYLKIFIKIDTIHVNDLKKYPYLIENLVFNKQDMIDNFCILRGQYFCWELVASIKRMVKNNETQPIASHLDCDVAKESIAKPLKEEEISEVGLTDQKSKWFLMWVKNDFDELRFCSRRFFVKHSSIIKAIGVARESKKTVRLSLAKCPDINKTPFGIYAISYNDDDCVLIGPYEEEEKLGIESVDTAKITHYEEKTRGVWVITQKKDNLHVIDRPTAFIQFPNKDDKSLTTLESEINKKELYKAEQTSKSDTNISKLDVSAGTVLQNKIIKPIRIKKCDSLYRVTPQNILKTANMSKLLPKVSSTSPSKSSLYSHFKLFSFPPNTFQSSYEESILHSNKNYCTVKKPIAEVSPNVKIINKVTTDKGMLILKPEEINEKAMKFSENVEEINMDIDNFIAVSKECDFSNEINLISDDEESEKKPVDHKDVWIECLDFPDLGWLKGHKKRKDISFQFPGFKFTEYMTEEEAFNKINLVLRRKVYVPKKVTLRWHVIESMENLKNQQMMQQNLDINFFCNLLSDKIQQEFPNNLDKSEPSGSG